MLNRGFNKITEFTKKQIGVLYRLAKNKDLKIEKWVMEDFYNLADYYGYDDNGSVEKSERKILLILDNVFSNDLEAAQEQIDNYTETTFETLTRARQQGSDRSYI
mgnify:CR=1 FL=1